MQKDMTRLGPIQRMMLVEQSTEAGNRSYRYQIQFEGTTLLFHFVVDSNGKIVLMTPEVPD
jgi:hypothetical protein